MPEKIRITITVNDVLHDVLVEPRMLLVDFLRESLELPGTHVGCEQGVCGACTVLVDGGATRSCLVFAAQLDGATVRTVESLASPDGTLHPIQRAFTENHGLQCGFCTPGMLMATCELLEHSPAPEPGEVTEALGGNLCRCTGYQNILRSVGAASRMLAAEAGTPTLPVSTGASA
ncbi:MAG TPA: (2Fe-2S)-binding protein [Pseudonocardia sp.]|jgi:aerobic-type carbon monoxide dehydrogenase small subunit (CoxS/CutS family)|uniref:(2Fe-2S)-binding protein n=1 Tax=Pseudonocardia sp. TaxID=60912 RepID=UPI002BAD474E|nr:(2Fe-2S)-binding protein [Pseudonocardia sp.]HTF54284.1 (2Fe-2S)-binding protein [Pseudonocardia sp.]